MTSGAPTTPPWPPIPGGGCSPSSLSTSGTSQQHGSESGDAWPSACPVSVERARAMRCPRASKGCVRLARSSALRPPPGRGHHPRLRPRKANSLAVAVSSGWVRLGSMCGFGVIHPLSGIWDALHIGPGQGPAGTGVPGCCANSTTAGSCPSCCWGQRGLVPASAASTRWPARAPRLRKASAIRSFEGGTNGRYAGTSGS